MKDIKIVIGANFGDCGKGLMTDYFSQKPNSIVVCSNGGAQRGHTVTTPDGIRHVFHHFGSGTFNNASTYLSEDFIVNPIIFKQEYDELIKLGYIPNVYINQNCMLTTPFDMMANQIIEENRGKNKHGSCGLGIFETIKRYKAGVTDVDNHIREYYLEQFERENIILTDEWSRIFFDNGIFEHFLDDWDFMNNHSLTISDNTEYFPHLTPSNTGIENPKRIIENVEWNDEINIETCYVSRTYLTRHGAGKFPSECNKRFINEYMFDKTNVPNPFQDTLRYGTLDLRELYSRCSDDVGNFGDEKSIAVTHCNEYDWDNDKLIELFKDWNIYYSDGETHNDVN